MRCFAVLAVFLASAAAFRAPVAPARRATIVSGRNDKRTKKGKIYAGSNGKVAAAASADPPFPSAPREKRDEQRDRARARTPNLGNA